MTAEESASLRAERLLRDVLGDGRFRELNDRGYLDLPSSQVPGRVYRLDRQGNLLYQDPGERSFRTTLCVQPQEAVPRDDAVAMRYLLITADEPRLLKVANPISFGFLSLARALHHDFGQHHHPLASAALTFAILGFFLGCFVLEGWLTFGLLPREPAWAVVLLLVFLIPALIGAMLVAALVFDLWQGIRSLTYRPIPPRRS